MINRRIMIENDLFDIANRLKAIDDGYYVLYDRLLKRYEIHNDKSRDSLQLILPYSSLDARTVRHVAATQVVDPSRFINEIDEYNNRLETSKIATSMDIIGHKVKSLVEYEERTGKSAPAYDLL